MLNQDGSEHRARPGECEGSYDAFHVTPNDVGRRRLSCRQCGRVLRPMCVRRDGRGWPIATVPFHKLPSAVGKPPASVAPGSRPGAGL
jgi:hypothetical protein